MSLLRTANAKALQAAMARADSMGNVIVEKHGAERQLILNYLLSYGPQGASAAAMAGIAERWHKLFPDMRLHFRPTERGQETLQLSYDAFDRVADRLRALHFLETVPMDQWFDHEPGDVVGKVTSIYQVRSILEVAALMDPRSGHYRANQAFKALCLLADIQGNEEGIKPCTPSGDRAAFSFLGGFRPEDWMVDRELTAAEAYVRVRHSPAPSEQLLQMALSWPSLSRTREFGDFPLPRMARALFEVLATSSQDPIISEVRRRAQAAHELSA